MLSRVLRTIRRQQLLVGSESHRVLCAVSGGPDSMALLACLWELAPRMRLTLEVATVDHGLRPEARQEIALVEERARTLGLDWHCVRVDVAGARLRSSRAGAGRGGVQEIARRLRLAALAELARSRRLDVVALGHQADDQAETVLFRILRGTGIAGLAGIPYRRDPFVRPLLDVTRAAILDYLHKRSLPYVHDPSNADLRFTRARLRHQILPLLRGENPRVEDALRGLASAAAAIDPNAVAGLEGAGGYIPARVREEIRAIAEEGHGTRRFDIPGGRQVSVSYGRVTIRPRAGAATVTDAKRATRAATAGRAGEVSSTGSRTVGLTIDRPGMFAFGAAFTVTMCEATRNLSEEPPRDLGSASGPTGCVWFDGDELAWPLAVRSRRAGDRMRARGGTGSRKLSDLLIDAKIAAPDRASLPVVTDATGQLLFVPGLRPSSVAHPSERTRRWIGLASSRISDHDRLVDPPIIGSDTKKGPIVISSGLRAGR